jgi:hypothetical protein
MDFENEESRVLFLKYAFTSLDKEHLFSEDYREQVLNDIRNGEQIEEVEESLFQTGVINCLKLSKRKGKEKIDKETIDQYFLGPHNNISECKAHRGVVMKVNGEVVIQTSEGQRKYKTTLEPNLEIGKVVTIHGDYVIKVVR